MRPDWSFVMVGPVVKIGEEDLPRAANIHYLGGKTYEQLPTYLSGWDVALMPFAMNELTQFISPTKTPEYLAGGKPVVSSPVRDVVRTYGHLQGVHIASDADGFVRCCEKRSEAVARRRRLAGRSRSAAVSDELGHDPSADVRAHRRSARRTRRAASVGIAGGRGMTGFLLNEEGAGKRYDYLIVGAGFRRLRARGAPGKPARRADPADRPPSARRRQCL